MAEHAIEFRRRRAWSTLVMFIIGSTAVHAAVLILVPSLTLDRDPPGASTLEVQILQPEPLPVVAADPAPQRQSKAEAARVPDHAPPKPQPERPAPVLALSEPRVPEESTFAVLADKPESPRPAPEEKPKAASVAVAPPSFKAAYLRNPPPRYPDAARRAGEQGMVTLRVLVTRQGLPARVGVEKSSGSTYLDNAALEAVKAWRFAPARRGAEPIESWMLVPVVFRLERSG